MKFKSENKMYSFYSDDLFYDLCEGRIDPDDFLEKKDSLHVQYSLAVIQEFFEELKERKLVEEG